VDQIEIDGSHGEGGGQILRTAISLSSVTGKRIRVSKIRAGRRIPGLRPQHLTAIQALASLFSARVENAAVGSEWITFEPSGSLTGGPTRFDVGTAGSIPMILLAIIPSVALSGNSIELQITGGTDVKASPTIDYLRYVVGRAYEMLGIKFSIEVLKRGYYPKGGGVVRCEINSCPHIGPQDIMALRKEDPKITSVCCNLPKHVAERQISSALAVLEKRGLCCKTYSASIETALSPGSSILVYSALDFGPFNGGDSIGELGKRAETVGAEAVERFAASALASAPVDPFLADMLVLPLSLANGRSRYRVSRVTTHLETNLHVARLMTGCRFRIIPETGGSFVVEIDA
jgi:RNA 3'-terminal phosphate cyclase (ATP)